jgi:hypothetical protein
MAAVAQALCQGLSGNPSMGRGGAYVLVGTRTSSFTRSKANWSTALRGSPATTDLHGRWGTIHPTLDGLSAAWMRRQWIDRAKTLLHDANLNLTRSPSF